MIVFETFELILCQMLSSQRKNAPSDPYPHYLVRLAASRWGLKNAKEHSKGTLRGSLSQVPQKHSKSTPCGTCRPGPLGTRVRKIRVRNSGAGNGCANFMDTWKKMRSFCRKNHVRKIPLFWGGFWGGGSADSIFMGARIFLINGGRDRKLLVCFSVFLGQGKF